MIDISFNISGRKLNAYTAKLKLLPYVKNDYAVVRILCVFKYGD